MTFKKSVFRLLPFAAFAILLLTAGCAHAAPQPAAPSATSAPAFLDAPNQVTVWIDPPTRAAALMSHVSVRCGAESIPVVRVTGTGAGMAIAGGQLDKTEVVLAGTFQSALGGSDWSTDDPHTRMRPAGPGIYDFQAVLPKDHYEYKIARGGTWAENYGAGFQPGGANIPLDVPADHTPIEFQVDFNRHTVETSLDNPRLKPSIVVSAPRQPRSSPAGNRFQLTLGRALTPADIVRPLLLQFEGGNTRPIYARDVLSSPQYFYNGSDLGATYTPAATTFKVWSPVSSAADLLLYRDASSPAYKSLPLGKGKAGVWSATVPGDLDGVYYQYRFTSYGVRRVAPDLYGRAASADLQRTMVVDLARSNPPGWSAVPAPRLAQPTDAIVYEAHIRDFTIDSASGVPAPLRGKYLGVVAPSTFLSAGSGVPTGLSYLQSLGVTDLHLLPFQSIAQHRTPGYNWGYETFLFDVPEPRYATNPADPAGVIREVKTMVAGLHRAHIGLVMDVVYNHTVPASGDASPLWAAVPYYYFRTDDQGKLLDESGVGNAVDDDHPMVRKYICDSVSYWATQYHVDGFRFDLLGMFEPQTVAAISQALHKIRPGILLYGEPWTGGGPTRFGKGKQRGLGVAVFNDNFRNALRGDLNGTKPGFALGGYTDMATLRTIISGSPDFAQAPSESMNYVSIHDDMTLWDKITHTLPDAPALQKSALKLAGAMVLLSQGVPILEGGAEMGRTKQGSANSYNAGDTINRFDWQRGAKFADVSDYYRGLVALRRAHPAFRCATARLVGETLAFLPASALPANTVAFTLIGAPSGDAWSKILVVFHGAANSSAMALPPGRWRRAVEGNQAQMQGDPFTSATLGLAPLSATVLYQAGVRAMR